MARERILIIILVALSCVACVPFTLQQPGDEGPTAQSTLANLNRGDAERKLRNQTNKVRLEGLRETAQSLGARGGLAWRVAQINEMLERNAMSLDQIFNFNALALNNSVMPPVLVESRYSLNMETPQTLRIADRSYKIVRQARFVTTPPTWRQYLIYKAPQPGMPDVSLLPKNSTEEQEWRKDIAIGWDQGLKQADDVYSENLARLKRDFQGMIRYRVLLAQNIVSSPEVAERSLGITGGGEEMAVNDRVLTITTLPSLKADSKDWDPAVVK